MDYYCCYGLVKHLSIYITYFNMFLHICIYANIRHDGMPRPPIWGNVRSRQHWTLAPHRFTHIRKFPPPLVINTAAIIAPGSGVWFPTLAGYFLWVEILISYAFVHICIYAEKKRITSWLRSSIRPSVRSLLCRLFACPFSTANKSF